MPTVTNTVRRPDGTLATGRVTIDLVGTNGVPIVGYVTANDYSFVGEYSADIVAGVWSVTLTANSLITPAGTRWRVVESVDGRFSEPRYLLVPNGAGPYLVEDILSDAPAALADGALSAHLADTVAAHAASAVSFTPTGTIAATDVQAAIAEVAAEGSGTLDPDLEAIAALDSTQSGVIASDGAGWIRKTYAAVKTALGSILGSDIADDALESRHFPDGVVTPPKLSFVALTSDDLGKPVALPGAVEATRYVGGTTTGAPTTGTFVKGDFVVAGDGVWWICTVAGTPGTWAAPSGSGGTSGPAGGHLTGTFPNPFVRDGVLTETHLAFAVATQDELNSEVTARDTAIAALKAQTIGANIETTTGYPPRPSGFRLIHWIGPTDPGAAMSGDDLWFNKDTIAPPTPTGLAGTPGNTQATLTWNAVTAPDLAGYRLYRGGVQVYQGAATTATDTGLTNGTSYSYTVSAYDTVGNESAVSGAVTVTPATVPSAPAAPTATAGNTQATVSWAAPSDGGSPITGYRVTPYIGTTAQTATTVGNVLTTTITGLTNGTTYTFKVAAINAIGTGADSPNSNAVTPAANTVQLIQTGTPVGLSGTSVTGTLPANPTAGNTVVVIITRNDTSGAGTNMNTPSGFTQLYKTNAFTNTLACGIYYRKILAGEEATYASVTFTQTGGTSRYNTIQLLEFSNVADAPADATGVATVTAGTTLTVSTTAATTVGNSVVIATARTAATGTTTFNAWSAGYTGTGTTARNSSARRITTVTETPSATVTWDVTGDVMAVIASLKGR